MDVLDQRCKVRSTSRIVHVENQTSELIEALAPDKAMTHSPPVAANLCHSGGSLGVGRRNLSKDVVYDGWVEERANLGPLKVVSHVGKFWFVRGVVMMRKTLEGIMRPTI
jgi:hypothetical protein